MAYTTTALVKTYLGVSGSGDDTLISTLVTAAQAAIDAHCNRTFEASEDSTRSFTVGEDTEGRTLWLDEDLCAITTVTTNADNASPTTVTSSQYVTIPRNSTPYYGLRLLASESVSWEYTDDPEGGVTIEGKWAYSTTAPADIAQACKRLAAYFYRQKDSQVFDVTAIPDAGVITVPQGIPADVRALLEPFRRH